MTSCLYCCYEKKPRTIDSVLENSLPHTINCIPCTHFIYVITFERHWPLIGKNPNTKDQTGTITNRTWRWPFRGPSSKGNINRRTFIHKTSNLCGKQSMSFRFSYLIILLLLSYYINETVLILGTNVIFGLISDINVWYLQRDNLSAGRCLNNVSMYPPM